MWSDADRLVFFIGIYLHALSCAFCWLFGWTFTWTVVLASNLDICSKLYTKSTHYVIWSTGSLVEEYLDVWFVFATKN